jgi:hypothetical protein
MRRWGVVSILAVAGGLVLPAPARAIDHVSLFVSPTSLGAGPGWRLTASVPAPESTRGEILGVTLTRTFLNRRAEEKHALRSSLRSVTTVSFDGRRGRWNVRDYLGPVLSVNMRILARGAARPRSDPFGCRGAFVEVPVALRGTFVLRTGTAFFGTIRRVRLRGVVIFNTGGPVDCTRTPSTSCTASTQLMAWNTDSTQMVAATTNSGGWLSLAFRDPAGTTPVANSAWYHWMSVSELDPLAGQLPTLELRAPPSLPIAGAGTFTAGETAESVSGPCQTTTVSGTFAGTFSARFAGWGTRTVTLSGSRASYRVDR